MSYCNRFTIVKYDGERATAHPLRCRAWSCKHCRPWRKSQLVREATEGKPRTFITLTSNPMHLDTPEQRAHALVDAWRHIVRTLRVRPAFKNMQYFIVMERTERGEPHLHILARMPYLKQKWLSDEMRKLTNAPIVDIRHVDSPKHAAYYCAKYCGKDPHRYEGCKRYWRSLDWLHPTRSEVKAQRDPDTEFFFVAMSFSEYRTIVQETGWHISADGFNVVQTHVPPNVHSPPRCTSRRWK